MGEMDESAQTNGNYFYQRLSFSGPNMQLTGSRSRNRLASPRPRGGVPPLKPLKNVQMIDPRERTFLDAAERGDKAKIIALLADRLYPVGVNCTDVLGRSAIEIAVDNENVEIVEVLLKQPGIKIGNALLYAIREGVYKIVEMMINHDSITPEMLGDQWAQFQDKQDAENFEYSSDTSPIILAAHLNQFEILQLLLSRGATIHKPHTLACACPLCQEQRLNDSLHHSLRRIHSYRALASPAWISLTSSDPILTAFKLSWELQKLAFRECEFKDVYVELSDQCKSFACDLLSQCRSTEEVIAVLNKDANSECPEDIWGSKLSLARLKLAIKYEQKQFVAHPHCQQLLTSIWYEGFPGRRERGSLVNVLVCLFLIVVWPILSFSYILMPKTRIGQIVRSPFMKFLYYSTSFGTFLFLLTMATFESYRQDPTNKTNLRTLQRGPPPTVIEALIFIWVLGMIWAEVKQLWDEGFKKYVRQWWNWLDFIMMSLYMCTFTLRLVAMWKFFDQTDEDIARLLRLNMTRNDWTSDEPMLVSEGLFAVANIFSFARIIYLFQTNPYLGPLQISLGCMLIDIGKFFFIFFLVLSSFSIGLHQLYWYYDPVECPSYDANNGCAKNPSAFSSIANSYSTLLWSLFSITNPKDTEVLGDHVFTEWVGRGMYIGYHVTCIVVLLNMLIAMMSHSFQIINDHADMEWKFHRSKLWMSYFDEGSSLPAPFNIILTPKSVYYVCRSFGDMFGWFWGKRPWKNRVKRATIRRPGYNKQRYQRRERDVQPSPPEPLTYQDIMRRLVSRYIHMTKKEMKMDGVNEDDLLEIKQDISSLRYELREERRNEIQRSASHIDGVKKEIIRTLSVVGPRIKVTPEGKSQQSSADKSDSDAECAAMAPSSPISPSPNPSPTNFFAANTHGHHKGSKVHFLPEDDTEVKSELDLPARRSTSPRDSVKLPPGFPPIIQTRSAYLQNYRRLPSMRNSTGTLEETSASDRQCECLGNSVTLDRLKREIVEAIVKEIRDGTTLRPSHSPFTLNSPMKFGSSLQTPEPILPVMGNGELYETKLYTQL